MRTEVDGYVFAVNDDPPGVILNRAADHIETYGRRRGWLAGDDDDCCPLGAIARARGVTEGEVWCDTSEDGMPGADRVYQLVEDDPATAQLVAFLVAEGHGVNPSDQYPNGEAVYRWNDALGLTDAEVVAGLRAAAGEAS